MSESEDENFRNKFNTILQRIQNLPDEATELELPEVKMNAVDIYTKLCETLKIPIQSTFLSNVSNKKMDFSYHCLGTLGAIAVTKALVYSKSVQELNLSFNKLGSKSLPAITSLLNQNELISCLNLSNNEIGKNSAKQLGDLMLVCHSVTILDLSSNNLGDEAFGVIGTNLAEVNNIKILNLSTNDIGAASGDLFGSGIGKCSSLEELDLSRNHLQNGIIGIFSNLKKSNLRVLNVSNNAISDEAMPALANGIRGCKTLQEIDLSLNAISNEGAKTLAPGLQKSTLEILKLAYNPFQDSAANSILSSAGNTLKFLDLTGIKVNILFMKTYRSYINEGRDLKVLFGAEIRYDCLPRDFFFPKPDEPIDQSNAFWTIQKIADEKGISLKNVFRNMHAAFLNEKTDEEKEKEEKDEDSENQNNKRKMSTSDFTKCLLNSELEVTKSMAEELAARLSDGDGYLNMWEIITKLPYRPDDFSVKVKSTLKKPKVSESKKKGRGKKKK